jgi:integrase
MGRKGLRRYTYLTTHNGKPAYRAIRVINEKYVLDGKEVTKRRMLKGTGATEDLAEERLEASYKRYLVKTGEADPRVLASTPEALSLTTGEWLDKWMAKTRSIGKVESNTLVRYAGTIENHIKPHIGYVPIRLLDKSALETLLYTTLPAKKKTRKNAAGESVVTKEPLLGNSPMRKIYDILFQALKMAVDDSILIRNPMATIPRIEKSEPKDEGLERLTWLPARIMERLHGSPQAARWVLAFYGLRQSERLGLEHSSFLHLEDKNKPTAMMLNRQLLRDEATGILGIKRDTKTKAGRRIIPLPAEVSTLLIQWKKQQAEWKKSPKWQPEKGMEDLFFTTEEGKPLRHQTDNKQWHKMLAGTDPKKALPDVRHHAMRHLTATLLAKTGTHPEVAKTILGHSDVLMTIFYTHFSLSDKIQPVEALTDNLLAPWRKKEMALEGATAEEAAEAQKEVVLAPSSLDPFSKAVLTGVGTEAKKGEAETGISTPDEEEAA